MLLCAIVEGEDLHCRWEELLDALDAVSPTVEDAGLGSAYLDMHGILGEPARWCAQVRATLAPFPVDVRCGCAEDAFCAGVAARHADGCVVAAGGEAEFLSPFPLSALGIDPRTIERFVLLGIERIGELAALPHGAFVRRFGARAALWHLRANGAERRSLVPRAFTLPIEANALGEGEVQTQEQLLFALRVLIGRISESCTRRGRSAGGIRVDFFCDDASERNIELFFALPTAEERAIFDVLRARLERERFDAPVVGMRVRALRLEEAGSSQMLFVRERVQRQDLAVALARLEGLLGEPVRRARLRPAHAFEERFSFERFTPDLAAVEEVRVSALPALPLPPLQLIAEREVAVELRGGVPIALGSPPSVLCECVGPWRTQDVARELPPRDEYDVALSDGRWYRIVHRQTRWYLCGVYE
ncbi:MAG: hypothetical protein HKL92_05915 [Candidatus Eremiobacteraeota bacterium]|nr:hypothetical protein [Candidatus Eremiobacteraeota bacterium]NNM92862.1 hypothetical protein [Candidatus Eremiobacteraeota bacterium]